MGAHRTAAVLAASALLALGTAACTSNSSAGPAPSASTSPTQQASQSPSPTSTDPSPPVLPAAAKGTGPKAAKAFVRYYFRSVSYAIHTGDTDAMEHLSTARCHSCRAIARDISKVYETGGHVDGGGWFVTATTLLQKTDGRYQLIAGLRLRPETVIDAKGHRDHTAGGKQPFSLTLQRRNGSFKVTGLVRSA